MPRMIARLPSGETSPATAKPQDKVATRSISVTCVVDLRIGHSIHFRAQFSFGEDVDISRERIDEQGLCVARAIRIGETDRVGRADCHGVERQCRIDPGLGQSVDSDLGIPAEVVSDIPDVEVLQIGIGAGTDGDVFPVASRGAADVAHAQKTRPCR